MKIKALDDFGNFLHTCDKCLSKCDCCSRFFCRDQEEFKRVDGFIFCETCYKSIYEEEKKHEYS